MFFTFLKHVSKDAILVGRDCLAIALAKSSKHFQEPFVFRLLKTEVNKRFDCRLFNLSVQQVFVVCQQFCNSQLSVESVFVCGNHSLFEEQIDPLSNIVLVVQVVLD